MTADKQGGQRAAFISMDNQSASSSMQPAMENDLYKTDEFRMYCAKILPCSKRYSHDWPSCPFSHPGEKAKRRDPRTHKYDCEMCPSVVRGEACPLGNACSHSHNVFESWLHPQKYRTLLCKEGARCYREAGGFCFFAHGTEQLRVPDHSMMQPAQGVALDDAAAANAWLSQQPAHGGTTGTASTGPSGATAAGKQQSTAEHGGRSQNQHPVGSSSSGSSIPVHGSGWSTSSSSSTTLCITSGGSHEGRSTAEFTGPAAAVLADKPPSGSTATAAGSRATAHASMDVVQQVAAARQAQAQAASDMQGLLASLVQEVQASEQEAAESRHAAAVVQQRLVALEQAISHSWSADSTVLHSAAAAAAAAGPSVVAVASSPGSAQPCQLQAGSIDWMPALQQQQQQQEILRSSSNCGPMQPLQPQQHVVTSVADLAAMDTAAGYTRRYSLDEALLHGHRGRLVRAVAAASAAAAATGNSRQPWCTADMVGFGNAAQVQSLQLATQGRTPSDLDLLAAAMASSNMQQQQQQQQQQLAFAGMPNGLAMLPEEAGGGMHPPDTSAVDARLVQLSGAAGAGAAAASGPGLPPSPAGASGPGVGAAHHSLGSAAAVPRMTVLDMMPLASSAGGAALAYGSSDGGSSNVGNAAAAMITNQQQQQQLLRQSVRRYSAGPAYHAPQAAQQQQQQSDYLLLLQQHLQQQPDDSLAAMRAAVSMTSLPAPQWDTQLGAYPQGSPLQQQAVLASLQLTGAGLGGRGAVPIAAADAAAAGGVASGSLLGNAGGGIQPADAGLMPRAGESTAYNPQGGASSMGWF